MADAWLSPQAVSRLTGRSVARVYAEANRQGWRRRRAGEPTPGVPGPPNADNRSVAYAAADVLATYGADARTARRIRWLLNRGA